MVEVLYYFFVASVLIQIIYYLFFSVFILYRKTKSSSTFAPFVSVIICAKNEEKNLTKNLPYILKQEYTKLEVILVNDASTDTSLSIMKEFQVEYDSIKIIDILSNNSYGKKHALSQAIKAAKGDYILLTDADCRPNSNNWISAMAETFCNDDTEIVLGYGKYEKKKGFTNSLIRYETLLTAVQYFSYALLGIPYMGVGRNLAYKKALFTNNNGFENHKNIISGDDDLFIKEASTTKNTSICITKNSFTSSTTPNSFSRWFRQKRRHITTSNYYKMHHKILLGLFFLSKFWMFFTFITLLFIDYSKINLFYFLIYLIISTSIIGLSAKKLKEKRIIFLLPFLDFSLVLFQFSIFVTNKISKPLYWK